MRIKIGNSQSGCKIALDQELFEKLPFEDPEHPRLMAEETDQGDIIVSPAEEGQGSSVHAQKNTEFPWCATLNRSDPLHTRSEMYGAEAVELQQEHKDGRRFLFHAPKKNLPVRAVARTGGGGGGRDSMSRLVEAVELVNQMRDELNINLSIDADGYLEVTQRIGR